MKCNDCIHRQLCPMLEEVKALRDDADKFFNERTREDAYLGGTYRHFELNVGDCNGYKQEE